MNIDPVKYKIETNVLGDGFEVLKEVLNVSINIADLYGDSVVQHRSIMSIYVDCIVDGKATVLNGDTDQFKFIKR